MRSSAPRSQQDFPANPHDRVYEPYASVQANTCASVAGGPELELQGERGTLGISLLDVAEPLRTFTSEGIDEEVAPHIRSTGPDHLLGVEHLVDCIHDGRDPVLDLGHAGHVIDVLEAAQQSATSGRIAGVRRTLPWRPIPLERNHALTNDR